MYIFILFNLKCLGFLISVYLFVNKLWFFSGLLTLVLSYRFLWNKDDKPFNLSDPRIIVSNNGGTFRIPNDGHISHFQGKYRCFASNKLGIAMSEEIEFIVPSKYFSASQVVQW